MTAALMLAWPAPATAVPLQARPPIPAAAVARHAVAVPAAARAADPVAAEPVLERRLLDERIVESSGLARSLRRPELLWTINDGGSRPEVYGIGPDGRTVAVLRLRGVNHQRDWEALTSSGSPEDPFLWVADIGDNDSERTNGILVHRLKEPAGMGTQTVPVQSYRLRYPDGPHDAEALLVEPGTGRLYVVTKGLFGGSVYRTPGRPDPRSPTTLQRIGSAPAMVTDATFLGDGRAVLLDHYSGLTVYSSLAEADAEKASVDVELPLVEGKAPQTESVTPARDGESVLIGAEGKRSGIFRVPLPGHSAVPPPARTDAAGSGPIPGAGLGTARTSLKVALAGGVLVGGAALAMVRSRRRRR